MRQAGEKREVDRPMMGQSNQGNMNMHLSNEPTMQVRLNVELMHKNCQKIQTCLTPNSTAAAAPNPWLYVRLVDTFVVIGERNGCGNALSQ